MREILISNTTGALCERRIIKMFIIPSWSTATAAIFDIKTRSARSLIENCVRDAQKGRPSNQRQDAQVSSFPQEPPGEAHTDEI